MQGTEPSTPPGCGVAVAGLIISGTLVSLALSLGMGFGSLFPLVAVATLLIVGVLGGPAYLLIRKRPRWWNVSAGGFVTGTAIPTYIVLTTNPPQAAAMNGVVTFANGGYTEAGLLCNLAYIGGFGVVGVIGAMVAWIVIRQLSTDFPASARRLVKPVATVGAMVAGATAISAALIEPWGHEDNSCHNPHRNGEDSIGSVGGFELNVGMREWREVESELEAFARDDGWNLRSDVRTDPGFPWFQISLCREPGTVIYVHYDPTETDRMYIGALQPQGGNSWESPLREIKDRLERRWPGEISYDGSEPRPPWAPPASGTADAPLHPRKKSL